MDICNGSLFWDSNTTWYSSWPEFTECFQDTVLVLVPCGWLWLAAPFYLYYLVGASGSACSPYKLYIVKMVLCGVLAAISTVLLVQVEVFSSETITAQIMAPSLQIVTLILAMLLMYMERRKGFITSGVLFIYWLLLAVTGIVPFYTIIIQKSYTADVVTTTSFYAHYCLVLVQLLLSCFPDHTEIQPVSPEVCSAFPSRITFAWVTRLIIKGYKKVLTEIDIDGLHPRDRTSTNVFKFLSLWQKHSSTLTSSNHRRKTTTKQQRRHLTIQTDANEEEDERTPLLQNQRENNINSSRPTKDASLLKALLRTFWFDMIRSQIWKIFYDLLYFTNPLLLGELILFTEDLSSPSWKGYTLSVIMFTSILVQSVFYHATWHHSTSVALRIRAVLISAIYRKALSMSSSARSESSSGEVVNLMSVDCEHIKNTAQWVWATWSSLLQVVLSLLLLYNTLGLSMLAGLAVLVLLVPFNYLLASKWQKYQVQLMKFKDSRMKMIGEVLNAMKIIKLYAWEPFFEERIADIRDKEIHFLWKISLLEAFGIFTWALSPYLVSFATLLTYVYTAESHYLDALTAFVAVALLNNLGYAVNALPEVLSACVQAHVSLKRISKYLKSEDLSSEEMAMISNEDAVSIQNATFAWNYEKRERPHLQNISMNITRGSLVAIIGQVGDGKSSLLSALLGEMKRLSGTFCCKGSRAYVPQQAWIQNDTLQNNILFGKDLDRELYRKVIQACALQPDLDLLPAGDQTEIGERGINLSGGQKQRVSLARAVYNDADIYLLDDPLSAVDSHVGKHIFEELISRNGLLQNKTRILVTHGVQWLSRVDLIVVMSGGRIEVMGTYSQLQKRSASFSNYLQQCLQNDVGFETEDVHRLSNERSARTTAKDSLDTSMDVEDEGNIGAQNTGQLIDEEFTEEGKVTWSVYATYAKAIGSKVLLVCGTIYACYQAASVIASIWLSRWTDNKELANFTLLPANSSLRQDTNNYYFEIYGGLGVVQSVCMVVFAILWASRTVKASRILHKEMTASILRAPMAFFDTTPTGRLINRFSQDIDTIDLRMQHLLQFAFNTIFVVLSCFIVISYSTPIFIVVILPVLYINTSRQLKRLESKSRSPIYSHFSETLAGVSVIRAMKQQDRFIKESESRVDTNQRYIYYGFAAQRWLGFRLETLGNFIILAASMFAVASRDTLSGGIMGLTVSYALQITQNLYYVVKMISELETQAVSVERVKQYTDIEPESAWSVGGCLPSPHWPWNGEVRFRNYSTRYRRGLDLILSDVSCTVAPGEKVGVVGRTGAGKSSLTLSLFRLIEPAGGEINIDGLDISSLGLHDLRRRLTILPQDPVLFSGSLRDNVDPFNQYSDSEIWTVLDHAHLRSFVTSLPAGLQHECTEGGENISVGQRQLLCLARALLRKTKILVLDEATAAVDMETDDLIQQTIRSEFKDCTVLTIAHRLNTVMDYDRILVLEQGRVMEFDSPGSLVEKKGLFYKMTVDAGLVTNSRTVSS